MKRKKEVKEASTQKEIFKRILKYLKKYWAALIGATILALISVVASLYIPILIGDCVDLMVGEGFVNFSALTDYLIKIGVCIAVTAVSQWIMSVIDNAVAYNTVENIRCDAFKKICSLPFSYIDNHPYGDVANRVIADVDVFSDGLLLGFTQLFTGIVTILATIVFMLTINWLIALAVIFITPLSLFVARFIATRTYSMFKLQSATRGEQTGFIDEMIGNLKVVKAFTHEDANQEKFDEINERLRKSSLSATFFSSLTNPCTRFLNAIVYALVAFLGALFVINSGDGDLVIGGMTFGAFTVGALSKFLSYATQYTKPFNDITSVITEFQNALACASRIFEIIDAIPETPDKDNEELPVVNGNVCLKDVAFSYSKDRELITGLNLSVNKGQRIAIVGPTGCGKTTIINLLMRFYDVDGGGISVDGRDIRSVTRNSLRKNYGMVLQETWLKNGTIKENIAMGKEGVTDEEIIAAAKETYAHQFIVKLKDGYDTVIGEDGGGLSQGQKQLLCITRVMLELPPMLILDEATSSIDTRTELKIQDTFAKLMKGRTSFIVAHRLSTIKNADVILVMKDGHIIEQGNHKQLLAKGGFYSNLYNSQFAV